MTDPDSDTVVERFAPTSGRISGVAGLITAGVVLILALLGWDTGTPLGVAIVALLGALMVWAAMLRPALWTTGNDLVMRGMLGTHWVPLAAIDTVIVTQVLAVKVGDRRFVSPVIGYTVRQTVKSKARDARSPSGSAPAPTQEHQAFVEARIAYVAQDARDRLGIRKGSPEQQALAAGVRHTWAWPELVATALLVLAFAVWVIL
ncbi:hypothetical protein GCM10023350_18300 [Nocardioides endophyticus]|uniref:PH domain-containing protein n=1 Tax=Nocardioides endophyticus TaxID=1353775 RepID=A0ABP8YQ20_9ACTN